MYYCGTVILRMTEQEFWRCTPRKLWALIDVHNELHSGEGEKEKKKSKLGFIDQVL